MKIWSISTEKSYIDGKEISAVGIQDLHLREKSFIEVRIGIKPDAQNVGGVNLFGERFGNYPQSLMLKVDFLLPHQEHNGAEQ